MPLFRTGLILLTRALLQNRLLCMARKEEIITFKADEELIEALEGVPNRSAFIRDAIFAALDNRCPLCRGTGILSPEQKKHWNEFARHHHVEECGDCHAFHIVCDAEEQLGRADSETARGSGGESGTDGSNSPDSGVSES